MNFLARITTTATSRLPPVMGVLPSWPRQVTAVRSIRSGPDLQRLPGQLANVVAVGGTTLSLSGDTYVAESGWFGGGGQSQYETEPGYQSAVQQSGMRQVPDVAFDADPYSGVAVYDSYSFGSTTPWIQVGGTSVSAPCWAGLVAIADQLRPQRDWVRWIPRRRSPGFTNSPRPISMISSRASTVTRRAWATIWLPASVLPLPTHSFPTWPIVRRQTSPLASRRR